MKKLLLVNSCQGLYGGIESFLLNIFYGLDRTEFDVTFLTCGKTTYRMFENDIQQKGGKIHEIPIFADSLVKQIKLYHQLRQYYRQHEPDIVHINSGGLSFHFLAAKAAKDEGIETVILHSHNFIPGKNGFKEKLKNRLKEQVARYGDVYLACSRGAAKWIFPDQLVAENKVVIIPNGIDTQNFRYTAEKRKTFRDSLGLGDGLLIGNIGRFQKQKNHFFMLKVLLNVVQRNPDAKLLLIGDGELRQQVEEETRKLGLEGYVLFLGERKDIPEFLAAIDVFILPSVHEGLPISAIEAQTSGTRVLLADTITTETDVTGRVVYLPIEGNEAVRQWVEVVLSNSEDNLDRGQQAETVKQSGYDVSVCKQKMKNTYLGASTGG